MPHQIAIPITRRIARRFFTMTTTIIQPRLRKLTARTSFADHKRVMTTFDATRFWLRS